MLVFLRKKIEKVSLERASGPISFSEKKNQETLTLNFGIKETGYSMSIFSFQSNCYILILLQCSLELKYVVFKFYSKK